MNTAEGVQQVVNGLRQKGQCRVSGPRTFCPFWRCQVALGVSFLLCGQPASGYLRIRVGQGSELFLGILAAVMEF